ncbi:hypothetical protein EWB00_007642 [Schistosoma japonicum]|uniref:Uncharacterized protein n=1 Tax=Schistosoma japonicum TaxID=6182 RepID=A0A4Z2CTE6_SCHJA|nr:Expressed conserved protein [Schistosoma japonicum]TNN07591.1 hypothetical protein EWB00_007642 [Schistosoma japonicum]
MLTVLIVILNSWIWIFVRIQSLDASILLFHKVRASSSIPSSNPPSPPLLPKRFYTEFTIYYTPRDDDQMPLPPWSQIIPPQLPYAVGRGMTWYANDLNIAIEYYEDYCVPIFEPASYFPCIMFNYNHTAYLIAPIDSGYGPCCVYRKPFEIPPRNFMNQLTEYYNGTTEHFGLDLFNQTIQWWIIPPDNGNQGRSHMKPRSGSSLTSHPVFGGYGWTVEKSKKRVPVCFWYEGNVGWTQQLFFNFVDDGPRIYDLDGFQLPGICETNMACTFRP